MILDNCSKLLFQRGHTNSTATTPIILHVLQFWVLKNKQKSYYSFETYKIFYYFNLYYTLICIYFMINKLSFFSNLLTKHILIFIHTFYPFIYMVFLMPQLNICYKI